MILFEKWRKVMRSDAVLKVEVIDLLLKTFGVLETERFITSIKSNNFNYTEWQKTLWNDKSIEELHKMATEFEENKYINPANDVRPVRAF